MRKLKLIIATAALMATGCTPAEVTPEDVISFAQKEVEMSEGQTLLLEVTMPEGEADNVEWGSSNDGVAEISAGGLVTAHSVGEATVTASLRGDRAECLVRVVRSVPVEQILMPRALTVIIGKTAEIEYTLLPFDASDWQLTWNSLDVSTATVENGIVTGLVVGVTTVTASAGDVSADCRITVIDVPVERIELSTEKLELGRGGSDQITATVWPEEARYLDVTWESSDPYVATVTQDGTVRGVTHGNVVITVTAGAVSAECEVAVNAVPNVGDYLYSDKTWSAEPNPNKEIVGVVFWVGDPSADDPMLRAEHPECVNGLAVSLGENNSAWQPENRRYPYTVNSWVRANTTLPSVQTDENDSYGFAQKFLGYGMTKSLEAFNAAPENSTWRLEVAQKLAAYRERNPAAEGSSGWYIPSVKELKMLCTGESGGRPDWGPTTNKLLINSRLMNIGANQLESYLYYSTIEVDFESALVFAFDSGNYLSSLKQTSRIVRFVTAF